MGRFAISAGEPSGDLHGAALVKAIAAQEPGSTFYGFGGPELQAAGCDLVFPLADHPIVGVPEALRAIPMLRGLLADFVARLERDRPDGVILIDNPGFNWYVAAAASRLGIRVTYHLPPQLWAWGTWRIAKVRKHIDRVLCNLPFEEAFYRSRGVRSAICIGHPFFDELASQQADEAFLLDQKKRRLESAGTTVLVLPGSRGLEIRRNTPVIAAALKRLTERQGPIRVVCGLAREQHLAPVRDQLEGFDAEFHLGRTRELAATADVAIVVSGSVSLELLYEETPAVVLYKLMAWEDLLVRPILLHTPFITLVNLLAGRAVYPEFFGCGDLTEEVADAAEKLLADPRRRARVSEQLFGLRSVYAQPGANERAAEIILSDLRQRTLARAA